MGQAGCCSIRSGEMIARPVRVSNESSFKIVEVSGYQVPSDPVQNSKRAPILLRVSKNVEDPLQPMKLPLLPESNKSNKKFKVSPKQSLPHAFVIKGNQEKLSLLVPKESSEDNDKSIHWKNNDVLQPVPSVSSKHPRHGSVLNNSLLQNKDESFSKYSSHKRNCSFQVSPSYMLGDANGRKNQMDIFRKLKNLPQSNGVDNSMAQEGGIVFGPSTVRSKQTKIPFLLPKNGEGERHLGGSPEQLQRLKSPSKSFLRRSTSLGKRPQRKSMARKPTEKLNLEKLLVNIEGDDEEDKEEKEFGDKTLMQLNQNLSYVDALRKDKYEQSKYHNTSLHSPKHADPQKLLISQGSGDSIDFKVLLTDKSNFSGRLVSRPEKKFKILNFALEASVLPSKTTSATTRDAARSYRLQLINKHCKGGL